MIVIYTEFCQLKFTNSIQAQQRDEIRIKAFTLYYNGTNLLTSLLRVIYESIFITEKTALC